MKRGKLILFLLISLFTSDQKKYKGKLFSSDKIKPKTIKKKDLQELKAHFLKIYSNLPEPERYQVIAIIGGKTYSWNLAYNEISNDTNLGKKILRKMQNMRVL